jgi:hypothetical protein
VAVKNTEIRHQGYHHGASYIEHLRFRDALLHGREPDAGLKEGLWSVAVGAAAQLSIREERMIDMDEVMGGSR